LKIQGVYVLSDNQYHFAPAIVSSSPPTPRNQIFVRDARFTDYMILSEKRNSIKSTIENIE